MISSHLPLTLDYGDESLGTRSWVGLFGNLFRGYLFGKYGGVPRVSSGMVAREAEEMVG